MALVDKPKDSNSVAESQISKIIRMALLVAFNLGAIWFIYQAYSKGFYQIAIVLGIIVVLFNVVFTLQKGYPFRYMAFGLAFMLMFVIYPIFFTTYIAFTNYGDGHLLTKEQALDQIERATYLPLEGKSYTWTAYKSETGNYALWLVDKTSGETLLAKPGEAIIAAKPGDPGVGEADASGVPATIDGYTKLNKLLATTDKTLTTIKFGQEGVEGAKTVQVRSPNEAAELQIRYLYDKAAGTLTDQETGRVFYDKEGVFTSTDGRTVSPGFRANIGWNNFVNFFTSPALNGPLTRILVWNFIFPLVSVLSTFALGVSIAIMYNEKDFPLKKLIRTLLLIPYTIPSVITILIWRGMLNSEFGVINRMLNAIIGVAPRWTTEPIWAQIAVLIVNLWLGFPYMMLITSGALQSIPTDMYEAATIDGAGSWAKFKSITLPLLLVAVGPLLIASYVFNFNNFGLIYLFIGGGPAIVGASTNAGHTDILLSYIYKLAFESGGRGVQYGLASAISIVLFILVGTMTLFQYRFTNMWEEVSENA
jgi:ABC-type sugar transport system permease subunit